MEINNMETNTPFKEIEEHVIKNTSLTITDTYMDSITVFGKIGTLANIDLTIEFIGDGIYECDGTISYQGYDANPTDILAIRKFTKSEEEVITLIDKSISIANKLIVAVCTLEKEVND
jgi:hypothetical protein